MHENLSVGFACNTYADKVKIKNYQERVENEGCTYLPAVFESFGGFSQDLPDFLFKLSKGMSLRLNESKSTITKYMYENLSCALMKSIAWCISSYIYICICIYIYMYTPKFISKVHMPCLRQIHVAILTLSIRRAVTHLRYRCSVLIFFPNTCTRMVL